MPGESQTDDDHGEPADQPPAGTGEREPTVEQAALRRQQLFVGSGVASLAGMAVVVIGLQQFPGITPIVPFGAGIATTAVAFGLVYVGLVRER